MHSKTLYQTCHSKAGRGKRRVEVRKEKVEGVSVRVENENIRVDKRLRVEEERIRGIEKVER